MRYKIFTLFAALTLSAGALFASDTAVDGIYYDFDATNLTATVTYRGSNSGSYADEYTGNVVIPATVTYGSNTYSVTSIGDYAFESCTALHEITALPTVPPTCGDNAFYNVPTDITLRCPCESREAYQAADTWSQFTNIIPADFPNVTLLADEEQGSVQVEDRICGSNP